MIEVVTEREPTLDRYKATCLVRTVDATGEERRYEVSLTDDALNGDSILAGKRVDDHEFDHGTPDGPTRAVYDAAREWFVEGDFEIYVNGEVVQ